MICNLRNGLSATKNSGTEGAKKFGGGGGKGVKINVLGVHNDWKKSFTEYQDEVEVSPHRHSAAMATLRYPDR